jgi:apolipoprotein N-acyltransferase
MQKKMWVTATLALVLPICISIGIFYKYDAKGDYYTSLDKCTVSVVQPNIPCYGTEGKYGLSGSKQHDILMDLLDEAPDSTEFVLMPETALVYSMNEADFVNEPIVKRIAASLGEKKPSAMVIAGTPLVRYYGKSKGSDTARKGKNGYYDSFNSALGIAANGNVQIHHKGKLVVGVETVPSWLRSAGEMFAIDLGGEVGQLGYGTEQKPFEHNGKKVAPAICYEGLYGNHMAEFVRNGAEALFVVSNDGWWGNTPGHKYLFKFCRLRAIETRRDVARSANTGVSGFITMQGEDVNRLEWDKRGVLTADIRLNEEQTFYTKYGDYIARLSLYIAALCLLYFVAYTAKKKFYLN